MPIKHTLEVFRGEDVVLPFDADEDITGWTISLLISDELADATPTLSVAGSIVSAAAGTIDVSLSKAQTATLTAPVYYWELARTNNGAETVLGFGQLTVRPRVGV